MLALVLATHAPCHFVFLSLGYLVHLRFQVRLLLLPQQQTEVVVLFFFFFSEVEFTIEDVDVIIPHQASRAGIEMFKRMQPSVTAKVITTLAENGNCIAASIPMSLHYAIQQDKLKRGETCLLIGTAAGFSIGALLFKY